VLTVGAHQKNARIADHQVSVQIVVGNSVVAGIVLINQQELISTQDSLFIYCLFLFLFHILKSTLLWVLFTMFQTAGLEDEQFDAQYEQLKKELQNIKREFMVKCI
jgi:hypothetical protein